MNLKQNNIIIGIDTSCYTTSIAAISLEKSIILNEKIMLNVKENSNGLSIKECLIKNKAPKGAQWSQLKKLALFLFLTHINISICICS